MQRSNEVKRMKQRPDVSLIVPIEEPSEYLEDCLRSIRAQTGCAVEILCVIGDSALATVTDHPEARVLHAEDGRFADCVNRCFDEAKGDHCMLVHPDDYLLPGFLEAGLRLAQEHDAELVLYETGERGRKTGTLRNRFISLRRELLPPEPCFMPRALSGNPFLLTRVPSWLALMRTDFVREKGIRWLEGSPNDYFPGRCALALAERACAVREPLAWVHEAKRDFPSLAREMEALYDILVAHSLWDKLHACFAHALLAAAVRTLRDCEYDAERLAVLDELCSESFTRMELLGRDAAFYRFPAAQKDEAFLRAALRRYARTMQPLPPPRVELISEVRAIEHPRVSVIMPAYQTAPYVEEAVRSILDQTLRELELICVDDGSADETPEILLRLAREDRRIVLLRQENRGVSAARNLALSHARGDWIYMMDSDDTLQRGALEELCAFAEENDLDVVYFNGENFYDPDLPERQKRHRTGPMHLYTLEEGAISGPELCRRLIEADSYGCSVCCKLLRWDYVEREGLRFHEGFIYEDEPFTLEVMLKAQRAAYLHRSFYQRRLRRDSIMTSDPRFYNALSCLWAYLDIVRISSQLRDRLSRAQMSAAMRRAQVMLQFGRQHLAHVQEEERGEAYGLGEDFALFRSLILEPAQQTLLSGALREQLAAEQKRCAAVEADDARLRQGQQEAQEALDARKSELKAQQTALEETRKRIRETEAALDRLRPVSESQGGEANG